VSTQDLTNLAALKAWLGLPATVTPSDATLASLVTSSSRWIYAALSRPFLLPTACSDTLDAESKRVFLRHWPVLSVTSVTLDGLAIPPATPATGAPSLGYALRPDDPAPPGRPQALDLFHLRLWPGRQNLTVAYTAGYAVQGESGVAPVGAPLQAQAPYGPWAGDLGVTLSATQSPLAAVAGPPGPGQYAVAGGLYTFNAAQAGAGVAISYGYIPQDLWQATLELAAERFRAGDRIGLRSKSLGGQETIAYDVGAISAPVLAMIQPYRRTAI